MTQFLFVTLGTAGNINPFVGIGLALGRRGHRVTVIANEHHERQVRGEGLGFARMGTREAYERVIRHPEMWNPQRSTGLLFDFAASVVPEGYAAIAQLHEPGNTVVAAVHFAFAGRIAHSTLRVPFATVVLTPVFLSSSRASQGPVASFDADDLTGRLNAFRAGLGQPPLRQVARWASSPQRTIALWPDWYCSPQPDWPSRTVTTGFIDYDGGRDGGLPPRLEVQGPGRPFQRAVVFTAGSINCQARAFFATAVQVCRTLGVPGLLLTRHAEQLAGLQLPPGVSHVEYAPFAELFSNALAVVHPGGIGTSARALRAALPQLIVPMVNDQFDNAQRLSRLGVALSLPAHELTAAAAADAVRRLLESTLVAENCRRYAEQLRNTDALERTCALLEDCAPGARRESGRTLDASQGSR
jgi:rhamnosyltransferase subunit B